MNTTLRSCAAALVFTVATSFCLGVTAQSTNTQWPSFRGHHAAGVADGWETPTEWSVPDSTNIEWKTPIPGLSHSSPIVWDNRIFITTAVSEEEEPQLKVGLYGDIVSVSDEPVHDWRLYAIDKESGKVLWMKSAHKGFPKVKRHPKSTHANSTPATDGEHVVAFFGSEGLYCYDLDGNLLWEKDLGVLNSNFFMVPSAQWGFASSPVIHEGVVVVQCDIQKTAFLAAFDVKTGNELWRTARDEVPTWSTPAIQTLPGETRVIVNGYKHTGGYSFKTGEEIWRLKGGGDIPIPTPQFAHGMIFISSAHGRMSPIYAIKQDATGDITLEDGELTNDSIAWSIRRGGSYLQTPLIYGDYLYNCRDNGSLTCYNAKTGEKIYGEKLGSPGLGFSASAVAADGKIYYSSEDGRIFVVKAGPEFQLLSVNPMDDICMSTPAISEGTLFFRTRHFLIAVSEN